MGKIFVGTMELIEQQQELVVDAAIGSSGLVQVYVIEILLLLRCARISISHTSTKI